MFCTKCGKRIPGDSRRCPECGADLTYENNVLRNRPDPESSGKKKKHTAAVIFSLVAVLAALECAWVFVLSPRRTVKNAPDTYAQAAANAQKAASDIAGIVTAAPTSDPAQAGAPTSVSGGGNAVNGVITPTPTAKAPTPTPTVTPVPTVTPTALPDTAAAAPTKAPTPTPTKVPTPEPTRVPTPEPTAPPTPVPTAAPTPEPEEPVWVEEETWIREPEEEEPVHEIDNETEFDIDEALVTEGIYFLPTDTERIGSDDLRGLSDSDIRIARNEIYARHGLIFRSDDLNEYFSGQPWYHGTETDADSIVLTPLEQENLETIIAYEELKGNYEDAPEEEETSAPDVGDAIVTYEDDFGEDAGDGLTEELPEEEVVFDEDLTDETVSGPPEEDSGWILPDSSEKKLRAADLKKLSAEDLRLARNEIYARHGLLFQSEDLVSYFSEKEWYEGTVEDEDQITLSEIEQDNIALIKKYEKKKASD